ncbi:MAG: hypothetical protein E7573_01135, partial [Ruminococcaceae bacterium]|nr:hypothetical protein [Oscillospiraceae bacterium]
GVDKESTRKYLKAVVDEFIGEIDVMESLKGLPNIVSVEDYTVVERTDDIGWNIYIRMELLTPFSDVLKERQLSEDEIISPGCDICTALEFCSKKNIIHRDIKPENIFINEFGSFKLGDFGVAKKLENMTGALSQKGTFNYMAPEFAKSADYDAGVHLYSLGFVLYRLLNGNKLLSGAQKDFEDIIYELESGIANVFSTSSFTSGGKKLTEYYADVDYDREYKGDTQVIADGYFNESKFRSSPYFDIRIDGIYLINEKF